jgi:hypothetical protein
MTAYLLRHPASSWALARAGWRLRRLRWWRRSPYLPLPDPTYWRFRVMTANGGVSTPLSPAAMCDAARWSLRQRVGK